MPILWVYYFLFRMINKTSLIFKKVLNIIIKKIKPIHFSYFMNFYYYIIIVIIIFALFFQRRVFKTTEKVPDKLIGVLDMETFCKAKSYGIDQNNFSIAEEWFSIIMATVSKNIKYILFIICF